MTALHRVLPLIFILSAMGAGCGPTTAAKCDFRTCNGCCDADGECQSGFANNACGGFGEACQNCTGAVCRSGVCTATNNFGGGGGTTGGGSGGGSTGGGTGGGSATGGGTGGGGSTTGGGAGGGSTTGGGTGGGSTTGGGTGGGSTTGGGTGGGGATPQPGDTCTNVTPIAFDSTGTASFSGDNSLHSNDSQGSCGDARDRVFSFSLTAPTWVEVSSTGLLAYHLRTSCAAATSELWCASSLGTRLLPAGDYFLWAESSGTFSLRVRQLPGETCETATDILAGVSTSTVTGTLNSYEHNLISNCATTGPDRAYTFTVTTPQNLSAELTQVTGFAGRLVLQSLASGCASPSMMACTGGAFEDDVSVRRGSLAPGRYVLWVIGSESGSFTLTASLTNSIPGDTCASALPLTFSSGSASTTGNTSTFFPDVTERSSSCDSTSSEGHDAFYVFTLTSPAVVDVNVRSTGIWEPVVYLRADCSAWTDLACDEGTPLAGFVTTLSAGTYFLVVDNVNEGGGAFTLDVTTSALPAPADICADAETPLLSSAGTVTTTGTTSSLTSNYTSGTVNTCNASGVGPDGVYKIEHPTAGDLTVSIAATSGSAYRPVMYLRRTCTSPSTDVACAPNLGCPNASSTLTATALAAGTYYLIVDSCGSQSSTGAYTLTVTQ